MHGIMPVTYTVNFIYNDMLQRIYYWYNDHLRIDLGFNIDMIMMMERFASVVELLRQMMVERFASVVELLRQMMVERFASVVELLRQMMVERFASLVELLRQMMVERFASLVELFASAGSMDSFFLELKRLMIACLNSRFVAFHHGRMLFFNGRTTASDNGRMVCLMQN
jgi:hypothetical protein